MTGFDCRSARGRRNVMVAVLVAARVVLSQRWRRHRHPAQQPRGACAAPAAPAQPAAPQPNPFMFSSDAAMLTFFIKPDKAADFEKVMAKLHQALANSDKPERKQQAAGWKLFKAAEPGPNGTVLYINFLSPALKGGDYTISKILAEVYPAGSAAAVPALPRCVRRPEPRRAEAGRGLRRTGAAGSARTVRRGLARG